MNRLSHRCCNIIRLAGLVAMAALVSHGELPTLAATPISPALYGLLKKNIRISNGHAVFTGQVRWLANKTLQSCHGSLQIGASAVEFPDRGPQQLSLVHFGTTVRVDAARHGAGALAMQATHGITRIGSIAYTWLHATAFVMQWDFTHHRMDLHHFQFHALGGMMAGSGALSLPAGALHIACTGTNINQAALLAHFAPQHFDVSGPADFTAALDIRFSGAITGAITVTSTKPGILRMYQIPVLGQMLTTTGYSQLDPVLKRMLRHYPYRMEKLSIAATARKTLIHLRFDRNKALAAGSQTVVITLHGKKIKVRPEIPHINKTFVAPPLRKLLHVVNQLFTPEKPDHH